MLKEQKKGYLQYHWQPRKKVKLDISTNEHYNQFKGDILEDDGLPEKQHYPRHHQQTVRFGCQEEQIKRNRSIYQQIKVSDKKIRKLMDTTTPDKSKKVKKQEQIQVKLEQIVQKKVPQPPKDSKKTSNDKIVKPTDGQSKVQKSKPKTTGTSNWNSFLQKQTSPQQKVKVSNNSLQAVAIDCEFVRSGDEEVLARLSIANEEGQCLMDSYVRPTKKITDFIGDITGITFTHLKNAPDLKTVLEKAKKIMYNKILVGHTVWKDLQVSGLKGWKGWKALVDISEYPEYKQNNGKLKSLKNLTTKHLGRSIQQGRHSSVQDAVATIQLYSSRRTQLLHHFKII